VSCRAIFLQIDEAKIAADELAIRLQ